MKEHNRVALLSESEVIEGDRIYLRKVSISDIDAGYYGWMNDSEVTKYLETRFLTNTRESLRNFVESKWNDHDNLFLAIVLKRQDRHVGNIKLGPINWIHRHGDIGIIVGEKDCWGKGIATEAITTLSRYAFDVLRLNKLTAGCYANNVGSMKAFQKAYFTIEGIRKRHYHCDGTYVDAILMGLLCDDS